MRILHVVPTYLPATRYGGPIRSVHGLASAQVRLGHDVTVYTTNVDGTGNLDVPLQDPRSIDGVKVIYFSCQHGRRLYWSPTLRRAIIRCVKQYDIVHLHSIFLWPTYITGKVCRKQKVPYVVSPRGMMVKELFDKRGKIRKWLWMYLIEKKNLEGAKCVHATSHLEESDIREFGLRLKRLAVVPNGIDVKGTEYVDSFIREEVKQNITSARFMLFVGRVNWKKGLDRLVEILPDLPGLVLVVAGNDEENYHALLTKLAIKNNTLDKLVFLGEVSSDERDWLMRHARLLVVPSYSENFGNVVLEAMSMGCPVVVSEKVGAAELVIKAKAGLVFGSSASDLRRCIQEIDGDEQARDVMRKNGLAAIADYEWTKVAQRMLSVYASSVT